MSRIFIIVAFIDFIFQVFFRSKNIGLQNRGVSFGFAPEFGILLSIVTYVFFVGWFIYSTKRTNKNNSIYLAPFFWGGGVNLVSRLIWGNVWDYICIPFIPFCFNLSDVLISFGIVSYILEINGNRSSIRR